MAGDPLQTREQSFPFSLEISLRPFNPSDIDDFMVWATDDRVSRFCSWDTFTSKETALAYLKDTILTHPWYRAICLHNRPVGAIMAFPFSGNDRCRAELGYAIASCYWGQGIATQAVKMAVGAIFGEWGHLERLEALASVENIASQRVLEKAGFMREGVLRKYYLLKGRCTDLVMFSFLSTDARINQNDSVYIETGNQELPKADSLLIETGYGESCMSGRCSTKCRDEQPSFRRSEGE